MGYNKTIGFILLLIVTTSLWKEVNHRINGWRKIVLTQRKRKIQRDLACEKFEYIMDLARNGTYDDLINLHRSISQAAGTMAKNGSRLHNYSKGMFTKT